MNKIKALIRKLFSYSFIRFAFVGGIATVVNYGIYLPLVHLANLNPNIAYLIAFAVSITCNYFLSSHFTFRVSTSWRRALQFLCAHLLNLVNELLLLNLFLWLGISKYYAPLCMFAVAFPINFFMVRFALKGKLLQRLTGREQ